MCVLTLHLQIKLELMLSLPPPPRSVEKLHDKTDKGIFFLPR